MSLTPGLVKTPLVSSEGRVTNEWAKYFESLEGASSSGSTATVLSPADLARIAAIESSMANILLRLRALELGVQM
jgi:hypothetical protein